MITQTINLNLIPGGVLPRINVSQYDKGSRALQFVLFNGAVLYSIENGTEITIQGSKPDNTAFQYSCTWSGSTASMDIEQQMTAVAGNVICELVISNNGEILGTCNFILYVEPAAVSDDAVISETDIPLIERAVEAAVEAAQSATDAAASAQAAAQSAASIGIATTSNVGVVKPDGTTITVDLDGTIHGNASPGIATTSDAGIVKPDGTTITVDSDGTIHGNASAEIATTSDAGIVKPDGTTITVDSDGTIHGNESAEIATTSNAGIVKPDGTTITVDQDGTIHGNASVTVDSALSSTSVNPVQNKVITAALGKVKEIIAPVETDPATNAWTVGSQIIYNDNLYKVITAITAGDVLVAYEDDPTNANIKLADPVETQLLNVKGNLSNRNLLDNAWFTVNQRGESSYSSSNSYTVDRWKNIQPTTATVDVSSDGITITHDSSTSEVGFVERLEGDFFATLIGKTITLSVMLADGSIKSASVTVPSSIETTPSTILAFNINSDWEAYIYGRTSSAGANIGFRSTTADSSISIRAAKLEIGPISTLAMDTAPNYAEELLKCQRYFVRIDNTSGGISLGTAVALLADRAVVGIKLPISMRAKPSVVGITNLQVVNGVSTIAAESIASSSYDNGYETMNIVATGTTQGTAYLVRISSNTYIDFSADL